MKERRRGPVGASFISSIRTTAAVSAANLMCAPKPLSIVGDEYVVLAAPCEVDRDRLVEAADRADAERVVALYPGDFFSDFAQPDGLHATCGCKVNDSACGESIHAAPSE